MYDDMKNEMLETGSNDMSDFGINDIGPDHDSILCNDGIGAENGCSDDDGGGISI